MKFGKTTIPYSKVTYCTIANIIKYTSLDHKITIISIIYKEPEWQRTKECIVSTGLPVVYVERNPIGVGSLAEAINRGVRMTPDSDFLFIVTNCEFSREMPQRLAEAFPGPRPGMVAIAPCFDSDHEHIKQANHANPIQEVPFVEFTAVMVRDVIMRQWALDEDLAYVGHDMDFGVRMRREGYYLCVDHREKLGHTYLRHKTERNAYTEKRKKLRKQAQPKTVLKLKQKYGMNYKDVIKYSGEL